MQGVIKNNPVHGLTPAISYATLKMQTYCLYGRVNFCQICALPPSSTMNQVCCSARQNERKNTNINHSIHSNSSPHTLKGSLCLSPSVNYVFRDQTSKHKVIEADDLEEYQTEVPLHLQVFGEQLKSKDLERL